MNPATSFSTTRRAFLRAGALAAFSSLLTTRHGANAAQVNQTSPSIIPETEVVRLFNGKDLTGLYTWLKDTGYRDPKRVFSVTDGQLRISGAVPGYIGTTGVFENYHLIVEYRWGAETYGAKTVRNSGILLHARGPDGNPSPW